MPGHESGLRAAQADDRERLAALLTEAFAVGPAREDNTELDLSDRFVLAIDGVVVATALSVRCGQWFGGRSVPASAVGAVAVASDRRGTGAGRRLMTDLMTHDADAGAALMTLYPSTVGFYRSLGFATAGLHVRARVDILDLPRLRSPHVTVMDAVEPAELEVLYRKGQALLDGPLDRSQGWWRDRVLGRHRPGARWVVGVSSGSGLAGYAVLSKARPRVDVEYQHDLVVHDVAWRDAEAAAELLGYLRGFASLGQSVSWPSPPGDSWCELLTGRAPTSDASTHHWMLRILDVELALSLRGWPMGLQTEFVLAVRDEQLTRNNGRWLVSIAEGRATLAPTSGAPELEVDVTALGALYSGWRSATDLVRHGMAVVRDEHLLPGLDACFAGRPWLGERF